jgi:hypothetical protein
MSRAVRLNPTKMMADEATQPGSTGIVLIPWDVGDPMLIAAQFAATMQAINAANAETMPTSDLREVTGRLRRRY